MIVMKFGGTSLKNAEMFKMSAEIALKEPREKIVVVSAVAGATNRLVDLAKGAENRDKQVGRNLKSLRSSYFTLLAELAFGKIEESDRTANIIWDNFDELSKVLKSISVFQELTPRVLDRVAAMGEILSSVIFSALLRDLGVDSRPVPPRLIRTNDNFGKAEINLDETKDNLPDLPSLMSRKHIPIIPGFIGKTHDGKFTTLGRNGSDYTAAVIANIFDAEELQIWKDVDGVMRADPKIVPEAEVLPRISHEEAMEMTYFGSKVLDPRSILPAIKKNIPIRVKNTYNPGATGTLIFSETGSVLSDVKVITTIPDLALINVVGKGMLGVAGIAARVFGATAKAKVNVIMISQASSEYSICFVIQEKDGEKAVGAIREEFELEFHRNLLEDVEFVKGLSIIAVIGDGMKGKLGVASKFTTALTRAGANIIAIAQGSSERNISVLVKSEDVGKAVLSIYDVFFKGKSPQQKNTGGKDV